MSEYNFRYNQRYAVYKAFDGVCQWCKEPVDFRSFHVDHVLPEELLNDTQRHDQVITTYGLSPTFNINNYENWIPSHPHCNLEKSNKVYQGLGIIKTILDSCAKNKELEQRIELKLNREPKKAELLASVQSAIELNLVNLNELNGFLIKTDIMDSDDKDLNELGKALNQKIEYQTKQMVKGIMDMVSIHVVDVINSLCSALGDNWHLSSPRVILVAAGQNRDRIHLGITNRVDQSLAIEITIDPEIIDNKLIINFLDHKNVFDQYVQDIRTGIDWEVFRTTLRNHYIVRLKNKIN